jgi:hypothetical protein
MSTTAAINAMTRCEICQQMRGTRMVSFHRNVGMIVTRRLYSMNLQLCRACIHRKFWEFQGKNLLLGPWGTFSLLLTPILLVQNTGAYLIALYKLRDAVE